MSSLCHYFAPKCSKTIIHGLETLLIYGLIVVTNKPHPRPPPGSACIGCCIVALPNFQADLAHQRCVARPDLHYPGRRLWEGRGPGARSCLLSGAVLGFSEGPCIRSHRGVQAELCSDRVVRAVDWNKPRLSGSAICAITDGKHTRQGMTRRSTDEAVAGSVLDVPHTCWRSPMGCLSSEQAFWCNF